MLSAHQHTGSDCNIWGNGPGADQHMHFATQQNAQLFVPAGSDIKRSKSYAGVVPVAMTNPAASASEAVEGAPVTGGGIHGTAVAPDGDKTSAAAGVSPLDKAVKQVQCKDALLRSYCTCVLVWGRQACPYVLCIGTIGCCDSCICDSFDIIDGPGVTR